jgi:hypothetical protein
MQQPLSRQFVELGLQLHTHDDLRTVYVSNLKRSFPHSKLSIYLLFRSNNSFV